MIRLLAATLSASFVVIQCNDQAYDRSPAPTCALDSLTLHRTVLDGLNSQGLRRPNTALEMTQLPVRVEGTPRLVITASWGGPSNGVVVWADCSGTILDSEVSGYVRTIESFVLNPQRTLIKVRAITGTGSGWKQESIHLYALHFDTLTLAWSGVVAERSSQSAAVGAYEEEGEITYVSTDSLVYSSTRFPLIVSTDGGWSREIERSQKTVLTYRWNSQTQKYEASSR